MTFDDMKKIAEPILAYWLQDVIDDENTRQMAAHFLAGDVVDLLKILFEQKHVDFDTLHTAVATILCRLYYFNLLPDPGDDATEALSEAIARVLYESTKVGEAA
nr:MAG: hypothetical protein DIU64_13875 [Caldicoprobacter oshimai]